MKTKKQLMDELAAKGIEFPENANKATLEELATANGISLELDQDPDGEDEAEGETATDDRRHDDKELIAAKMKAGLSHEAAIEVIERQRAEDAKNQD